MVVYAIEEIFYYMPSLIIIIAATLTPLIAYLIIFGIGVSDAHQRWGEFGSYLSGVYGSLAVVGLIYTTRITQSQILKQSEDTNFFKLFDLLQNKILQLSVNTGNSVHQGHEALKFIGSDFLKSIATQSRIFGCDLFRFYPEELKNEHVAEVFLAKFSDYDESMQRMDKYMAAIKNMDPNTKNEFYKTFFNHLDEESEEVKNIFSRIGQFYFYKVDFYRRKTRYAFAAEEIKLKYGGFLDSYTTTLMAILFFSSKSSRSVDYVGFLKSQLTLYEIIILFYLFLGSEVRFENFDLIKNSCIFDKLYDDNVRIVMFDVPSDSDIEKELSHLFGPG